MNMAVFEKVARGELTHEQGAELLMSERRPSWMPPFVFAGLLFLVNALVRSRRRETADPRRSLRDSALRMRRS
jgi:hypothetical protein